MRGAPDAMARGRGRNPRARLAAVLLALSVAAPGIPRAEEGAALRAPAPPAPAAAGPSAGSAPDNAVQVLTLDEALRIAAASNRDVRKAVEQRRQLTGRYVAERAAALPQATVTGSAFRSVDESQAAFGARPGNNTVEFQGTVVQPLYAGGQVAAAIRAARVGLDTAGDQLALSREGALRDVSEAFHDILLARELLSIAVQNVDQKGLHLDEARKKRDAGTATDYDVLVAEVALQNARPAVVRSENRVRTARERLRFLLGRGNREVDAQGTLDAPVGEAPSYEEVLAEALRKRPELSDIRHRTLIGEELVAIARAGSRPRVEARGGIGWKEVDTGLDRADGNTWMAGLFASWPLFDGWRSRGQAAQARSDVAALKIEEERQEDAIALEVRDAVNAVREAGEIVVALSGTVEQAERLLDLADKGYRFGVKTKLEVDDAQLNLVEARGNLARARRDYQVARVRIEFVKGTLYASWSGASPEAPPAGEEPWRPAGSPLGVVREVLTGQPRLGR